MFRDALGGLLKLHILHHARRQPVYGVWLIRELARHGYRLSPGRLYPTLHALEAQGLLEREDRVVAGKVRKYYWATPEGVQALEQSKGLILKLVQEVLQEQKPGP